MELSSNTISILKNFASINAGIFIQANAKILKTKTITNNVFAKADIVEDFPVDVSIYDLNEFLNVVSLFNEPNFDWQEKFVLISDKANKRTKVKYLYASKDLISYPEKDVAVNDFEVEFLFIEESVTRFNKAASMMVVEDVSLSNTEEKDIILLKVLDNKNSSSNVFEMEVGKTDVDAEFDFHFKAENLKMMSGDYNVGINAKGISRFTNGGLVYYIAIEKSSSYNI